MKKRFRNTFTRKLLALFIITICLPILLISAYSSSRIRELIDAYNHARTQSNLKASANSYNIYFEKYETITDLILISDTIRKIALSQSDDRTVQLINNRLFYTEISKLTVNTFDLQCVYLFTASGKEYFSYNNAHISSIRDKVQDFLADIQTTHYAILRCDGFFSPSNVSLKNEQYTILMMRALYNYVDHQFLGVAVLEFQPQVFANILDYSEDTNLVIDTNGTVVYRSDASINLQKTYDISNNILGHSVSDYVYDDSHYSKSSIETNYNFSIMQLVDYQEFNDSVHAIQLHFVQITIVSILIFVCIAVLWSKRLVHPLKELEHAMQQIEKGDLTQHVSINTKDEFAELGHIYNKMLDQLNLYIDRSYGEKLRRLDAEYSALQAQINPHFLYNTLETINSLAQINNEPQISKIVCSLATMFRYATVQHGNYVTVKQELTHLHHYLLVQQMSYEDQIEYTENIPKDVLRQLVPKLILQPLIENCFNHGFDSGSAKFLISLQAKMSGDTLTFEIMDSGIGISHEKLMHLQIALSEPLSLQAKKTSIGLANIHHRLQLSYGPHSGITSIESTEGCGTKITLSIPYPNAPQ